MDDFLKQLPKLAKDKHNENKKFFDKLKKKAPKNMDYVMQELHDREPTGVSTGSSCSGLPSNPLWKR